MEKLQKIKQVLANIEYQIEDIAMKKISMEGELAVLHGTKAHLKKAIEETEKEL